MDIVMPELDGNRRRRARFLSRTPGAVIIMCSALGQEALVIESIAAGAKDFIVKPFTAEKVLQGRRQRHEEADRREWKWRYSA